MATYYYKLSADQGDAGGQSNYGFCLEHGRGVNMDLKMAAYYYKLSADQKDAAGQFNYGYCREKGKVVEKDLILTEQYYKLAGAHDEAELEYWRANRLLNVRGRPPCPIPVSYLAISAEARSRRAQLNLADLYKSDTGSPVNHIAAAKYAEIAAEFCPVGCACYGWFLQNGIGVPINFTESCEFLQRAADGGNVDGANGLAICLERGSGIDKDTARAASYYRFAASQKHPAAMNNLGRCLEYGLGVERNLLRAAKYYRMSADLNNCEGANNFGICLERGIGVRVNLELAAEYYRRAADGGHADGANNLGFCLEHGRGVDQNIKLAANYYKLAADRGHPEADLNYRRCMRLLGRWSVPDRSSQVSAQMPSFEEGEIAREERFDAELSAFANQTASLGWTDDLHLDLECGAALGRGELAIVKLVRNPRSDQKCAVKTPLLPGIESFEREREIHEQLNHPLIVGFAKYLPKTRHRPPRIVSEFVPNGSLADHLPSAERSELNCLAGDTRVAIVVAGIVLAMRYLHWKGIIHCDLTPDNILVDWDWLVRIGGFGRSLWADHTQSGSPDESDPRASLIAAESRYTAPECFEGEPTQESDVFSFGLILYELLTGRPGLPRNLNPYCVMCEIVCKNTRPNIPDSVLPEAARLMRDCWERNPRERPQLWAILARLEVIDFQIARGVRPEKFREFAIAVKTREKCLGIDIEDSE
jgi:TPR repeat protein